VSDELIDKAGGDEEFCRLIIGKIVGELTIDREASHGAPLTVEAPTVHGLLPGTFVTGPGYCKIVDAHPIRPAEGIEEQALTYVCVCYQPLAPGESATDTSPSWPWP
jgi:hypothetical protein